MMMGEYYSNLDEKSRLVIPSKLRQALNSEIVITRGLDNCLFVYPKETFDIITEKLNSLPFTKKDARNFSRFFLSGASLTTFDKQGRINITSPLISYADLKKECVIVGVGDRLEIWDKDKWDDFYNTNKEEMSNIAEDLFDSNWELGE